MSSMMSDAGSGTGRSVKFDQTLSSIDSQKNSGQKETIGDSSLQSPFKVSRGSNGLMESIAENSAKK